MNILVAGGAGFIGSHLIDSLLADGHTVVCADKLIMGKQNIAHLEGNPAFKFYYYELADQELVDIIAFENYPFRTSGRGSREGVKFTYKVSRSSGVGGRHYSGASVDGYGNELWIVANGEKREKSISRSTVELGYKKAREIGVVKGPKALGLPGAGSYLWPVLIRLGMCTAE